MKYCVIYLFLFSCKPCELLNQDQKSIKIWKINYLLNLFCLRTKVSNETKVSRYETSVWRAWNWIPTVNQLIKRTLIVIFALITGRDYPCQFVWREKVITTIRNPGKVENVNQEKNKRLETFAEKDAKNSLWNCV